MQSATQAWNNFVMLSDPVSLAVPTVYRAAALANLFMSVANNGGLLHFLENTFDVDAQEVVSALKQVGAVKAAAQLAKIVSDLAIALPPMSLEARQMLLEKHITEQIEELDYLSEDADTELTEALERHVAQHEDYYLNMG